MRIKVIALFTSKATAMSSGQDCIEMAETLIVLVGTNAWSAAREFASHAIEAGDAGGAKHWRNVARAILRKASIRLGPPADCPLEIADATAATAATEQQDLLISIEESAIVGKAPAAFEAADPLIAEPVADEPASAEPVIEAEAVEPVIKAVGESVVEQPVEAAAEPMSRRNINAPIPLRARRQAMLEALGDATGAALEREAA